MRICNFFDEVMWKLRFRKDKELAEWLEVTPSYISQIRKGDKSISNNMALKIAIELEIDPLKVIQASELDKAERTGQRSIWENFTMARAASVLLGIMMSVNLFLTPQDANAAVTEGKSNISEMSKLTTYKLCVVNNNRVHREKVKMSR